MIKISLGQTKYFQFTVLTSFKTSDLGIFHHLFLIGDAFIVLYPFGCFLQEHFLRIACLTYFVIRKYITNITSPCEQSPTLYNGMVHINKNIHTDHQGCYCCSYLLSTNGFLCLTLSVEDR